MNRIKKWLEKELPSIADQLDHDIIEYNVEKQKFRLNLSGRADIYSILDKLLAVLFPGSFCRRLQLPEYQPFFIADALRHISLDLQRHAKAVLISQNEIKEEDAEKNSVESTKKLIENLPLIRKMLLLDFESAVKGDPAANSIEEVILSYPFVEAIATHRIAHLLYNEKIPVIPRIMSERAHSRTGIDIHPGATIAPGFFIDHGTGVVIGETCHIGTNVKIYQGVTLGALSPFDKKGNPLRGTKRHPDIEDDVILYANATILGGETVIGKGAIIGGNCWITKSIPQNAIVYRKNDILIKDKK